jgi:hypothetical protein
VRTGWEPIAFTVEKAFRLFFRPIGACSLTDFGLILALARL